MVALKDIKRDVSQGYDQFSDAFKHLRNRLDHSILELEDAGDLETEQTRLMKADDLADDEEECIEKREQSKYSRGSVTVMKIEKRNILKLTSPTQSWRESE